MEIEQNIALFQELVGCGGNLYTWCYDAEGQLLSSNCPDETLLAVAFSLFGCREQMLSHAQKRTAPAALGTAIGLIWAAAFEKKDGVLQRAYVVGPMFFSDVSLEHVENGLRYYNDLEFSLSWKHQFLKLMPDIPVVPNMMFSRYALMLHYCITGKKLAVSDFNFYAAYEPPAAGKDQEYRDRHKIWMAEQAMLQMVRTGNLNYKEALNNAQLGSNGIPIHGGDALRQPKDSLIVFISIVCRAAIDGGLSPEIAYSLGDAYIQSVEDARSFSDIAPIGNVMYDDFIHRVNKRIHAPKLSRQIRKCCDFIETHLDRQIRAMDLAKLAGYTEYYLTRKFREETGVTVSHYVTAAKIEQAKLLLATTELSVQEISDRLCFSTRSYLTRIFLESTGKTPREYRDNIGGNPTKE